MLFFSKFLYEHLNIGGIESIKLIDKSLGNKITIAFLLISFLKNNEVFYDISKESIEKLINWLFINININKNSTKTTNCARFLKI